jgi:hypothetical protein
MPDTAVYLFPCSLFSNKDNHGREMMGSSDWMIPNKKLRRTEARPVRRDDGTLLFSPPPGGRTSSPHSVASAAAGHSAPVHQLLRSPYVSSFNQVPRTFILIFGEIWAVVVNWIGGNLIKLKYMVQNQLILPIFHLMEENFIRLKYTPTANLTHFPLSTGTGTAEIYNLTYLTFRTEPLRKNHLWCKRLQ